MSKHMTVILKHIASFAVIIMLLFTLFFLSCDTLKNNDAVQKNIKTVYGQFSSNMPVSFRLFSNVKNTSSNKQQCRPGHSSVSIIERALFCFVLLNFNIAAPSRRPIILFSKHFILPLGSQAPPV